MNKITLNFLAVLAVFLAHGAKAQTLRDHRAGSAILSEMTKAEENDILSRAHDKATTCGGAASAGAVVLQDCADVGTAAFYTQGLNINATNSAATVPGVAESCAGAAGYTTTGTWIRVNPDPGVDIVDLQITGGAVAAGNHSVWVQFFQGSCAALTGIGCSELALVTMGLRIPINVHQEGINPAQDLWMYVWDDSGKAFNLDMEVIGSSASTITNDNCASASTSTFGCNLGANGDNTWTGPSNNGKVCTGGTWYSNENTVYFQLTAGAATGTIGVTGLNCNEGTAGQAQFGVWNSCACVGTYTVGCFRSCAVGTGTLSLTGLTPGSTYILVVDGQAGDICTWNFNTTGVILPVEMMSFGAKAEAYFNRIYWKTMSERDCSHFVVQRSSDGENYEDIATLKGAGTTIQESNYEYFDDSFKPGTNYYRLVQYDINGVPSYYVPSIVQNESSGLEVFPNPVSESSQLTFGSSADGKHQIRIYDSYGKLIYDRELISHKGVNHTDFPTTDMKQGIYFLKLSNESESKTVKFVK